MGEFCRDPKLRRHRFSRFPESLIITPGHRYYPNPGTIGNIHRKAREIMPDFFDGVELSMRKGLAPNKTLLTSWILSHTIPSGFRIGGIYSWRCQGNILETPTIQCDINPSTLSSNFSICYYPIQSLKIESRFQHLGNENLDSVALQSMVSLEYTRPYSTIAFSSYNPKKEAGRFTASYLRSVTDRLAFGTELLLEWFNNDLIAKVALAARYNENKRAVAATISREALDVSYWRQLDKSIQMGTLLAFNKNTQKGIGTICYQYDFNSGTTIRGMVDSDWSVGAMYEKALNSIPCIMGFSLLFCVPTNRFTFGFKMNFDPSTECPEEERVEEDEEY